MLLVPGLLPIRSSFFVCSGSLPGPSPVLCLWDAGFGIAASVSLSCKARTLSRWREGLFVTRSLGLAPVILRHVR